MPIAYDTLQEGDSLPSVRRTPATPKVLQFLAAASTWVPQFYDEAVAKEMGLEGPIVPAPLKLAYLHQYLAKWLDGAGTVRRLQLSHRRPDYHNVELTFGGAVTRKYEQDGARLLEVELWIDNPQGERSLRGGATIVF